MESNNKIGFMEALSVLLIVVFVIYIYFYYDLSTVTNKLWFFYEYNFY